MDFYKKTAISTGAASEMGLFLASEKGQFINGENIMIDGGRNAMGRWC